MKINIFVEVRHDDVILRHVTSFLKFLLKKWPNNTFPKRGQPLSYDKWFTSYRIFSFCRIFDDVITKNADVSENNDVIEKIKIANCFYNVTS